MTRKLKRILALVCSVCLLTAIVSVNALEPSEKEKVISSSKGIPIYVDGLLTCRGYQVEDEMYISLSTICCALDAESVSTTVTDEETETVTETITVKGVEIVYTTGNKYIEVNGRYLYVPNGELEVNGDILVPFSFFESAFNVEFEMNENGKSANIYTENLEVIESGETFYDAEDFDLMSHVIYSEAGNQSLEGMIAVGNVVMNRINSDRFPETLYDVVYQEGQFEPVYNGSIDLEPSDLAIVATALTYEGVNIVEDSLFFYNPGSGVSHLTNPDFVMQLEDHVFFR